MVPSSDPVTHFDCTEFHLTCSFRKVTYGYTLKIGTLSVHASARNAATSLKDPRNEIGTASHSTGHTLRTMYNFTCNDGILLAKFKLYRRHKNAIFWFVDSSFWHL
jgi:hypothetical protein